MKAAFTALLAQSVERETLTTRVDLKVAGSTPAWGYAVTFLSSLVATPAEFPDMSNFDKLLNLNFRSGLRREGHTKPPDAGGQRNLIVNLCLCQGLSARTQDTARANRQMGRDTMLMISIQYPTDPQHMRGRLVSGCLVTQPSVFWKEIPPGPDLEKKVETLFPLSCGAKNRHGLDRSGQPEAIGNRVAARRLTKGEIAT
ncbi:hypothetical protein DFH06DRAFT_1124873 [Mycena polygramma]|nr:hypothetical protein DFH06DRAFT_1124873 [Mycena polygramma]